VGELDPERRAEIAKNADPANWPADRRKWWEAMKRGDSSTGRDRVVQRARATHLHDLF